MLGLHLADLHLGKRLKEFSLIEEQQDVLQQVVAYCQKQAVRFVLIAGDVFDKGIPSLEALELMDKFLGEFAALKIDVFVLGGNHDSADRLAFLRGFLEVHHIHVVSQYNGKVEQFALTDTDGSKVNIYMLPYVKPADVRRFLPEEEKPSVVSYHDAVARAVRDVEKPGDAVNILVAHQFVTGAERCESEEIAVGGLDNVSAEALTGFDYVALGHIHSPQFIKNHPQMRYAGTPLKYSFSECQQEKSMTVLAIKDGRVEVTTEPFVVLHDLKRLEGKFAEVTQATVVEENRDSYVHITLTDDEELLNVLSDMRALYPRLCYLTYDNARTRRFQEQVHVDVEQTPLELVSDFFVKRSGHALSEVQRTFLEEMLEHLEEKP